MSSRSLAELNPSHKLHDGVAIATDPISGLALVRPNKLSSYLHLSVPKLFDRVDDLNLFSFELESNLDTPELKHEFNAAEHNLLRVGNFDRLTARVNALNICEDIGGSAGFLAEHFDHVDAITRCLGRAQLSASRNRASSNILQFCADAADIELPDAHYDFIYLGELGTQGLKRVDAMQLLERLLKALSPSGLLVLSSRNTRRLSRSMQYDSDEFNDKTPYASLYKNETKSRFDIDSLRQFLAKHDGEFENAIHASFSASGGVSNLFSETYLNSETQALNHLYRIGSIANKELDEYLVYRSLCAEGHSLLSLASRFNVIIGRESDQIEQFYNNDFTHIAGTSRRPQWRTITAKACNEECVTKTHTLPEYASDSNSLEQSTEPQTFTSGRILIADWLDAAIEVDLPRFSSHIKQYYAWLKNSESSQQMPPHAYDALPFNVLVNTQNEFQTIDPEWHLNIAFDARFVLFRALFWFAFENASLLIQLAERYSFANIGLFVRHFLDLSGGGVTEQEFAEFIELEESIQAEIGQFFSAGSIELSMRQPLKSGAVTVEEKAQQVRTEVSWADHNDNFQHALTRHIDWRAASAPQTIKINLPPASDSHPVLRLDPINNQGLFVLHSIRLVDAHDDTHWQLNGEQIAAMAELRNTIAQSTNDANSASFTALNADPFLLFDLSDFAEKTRVNALVLEVSLPFEPNYAASALALTSLVNQQAVSLQELSNKGHERQADIDTLTARLALSESKQTELANQLQHLRNVALENSLLKQRLDASVLSKFKRLIKRLLRR